MIPKASGACHRIGSMLHISNTDTLKSVYFAYFHSIIKHGTIFWGVIHLTEKRYLYYNRKILNHGGYQT
jgi:hypothetical protein